MEIKLPGRDEGSGLGLNDSSGPNLTIIAHVDHKLRSGRSAPVGLCHTERTLEPICWWKSRCGSVVTRHGPAGHALLKYTRGFFRFYQTILWECGGSSGMYTARPRPKSHTRLLLWLRSAFAVALFRQAFAMSQHLFPSKVALSFDRDFVLMTGESNHSFTLFL